MKLTPPNDLKHLAGDLGIGEKHLASLKVKYKTEDKLIAQLKRWWLDSRDLPRLLARRSVQGYTHESFAAMSGHLREDGYEDEPEAVPAEYQNVLTMQAHSKFAEHKEHDRAEQVARDDARRLAARTRDLVVRAARLGVSPVPMIARLEREIRAMEDEMRNAA